MSPCDVPRDPAAIHRLSFARVRAALDELGIVPPAALAPFVLRLVHACGLPEIARDLRHRGDPLAAARAALTAGAPVLCDTRATAAGILRRRLPAANALVCRIDDPAVVREARARGVTRALVAVEHWRPLLPGAVVAIGNAPTALFRLLELTAAEALRPAVVFAFPVGFVGAAESKAALVRLAADHDLVHLTLLGRFGGSALAAAAVNAVLTAEETM